MEDNFYEDMLENSDFKGNFKYTKVLIIILILLIIGFALYVTYLKLTLKKEEVETTNLESKIGEEIEFICADTCEYTFQVKGVDVTLSYLVSGDNLEHHKVMMNDTVILDDDFACGGPATLKVYDDIIVISYHNGCSTGGNYLSIYDTSGKLLGNYEEFSDINNMWMESTDFTLSEDGISLKLTGLYKEHILRLSKLKEVNLCNLDEWELYDVTYDTPTKVEYHIAYENGAFQTSYDVLDTVRSDILTCTES
jgi:hypothetical protein